MFELTTTMMKRSKFLIMLTLLGVSASFWQCGSSSSSTPNPQDEQLKKLTKTWYAKGLPVTFNSAPVTGYDGFTLTMTGTNGQNTFNYTAAGRPSGIKTPWNSAGTFTFGTGSNFSTLLTRDDNIVVTYSVSDTQLQMTFTYVGAGYTGRTSNVEGTWAFTFDLVP